MIIKTIKLFCYKGAETNATSYYIKTIESGIKRAGYNVEKVHVTSATPVTSVTPNDIIVTFTARSALSLWQRNKKQKIINWFQGVGPEESFYLTHNLRGFLSMMMWSYAERKTLKKSIFNFFVSEEMVKHYKKKYGYCQENYLIMPCFNQEIYSDCFYDEKYKSPSFVYAGSLIRWQCFDETVSLFKKIKSRLKNASLTVITNDAEEAKRRLCVAGLSDVEVKTVPYYELNNELSKYKYGFLIRENILLNNVATPTKMSSYLACGVIPIYSAVIKDFDKQLGHLRWIVRDRGSQDETVEKILKIENRRTEAKEVFEEYSKVFASYYCREKYIDKIAQSIKSILENK